MGQTVPCQRHILRKWTALASIGLVLVAEIQQEEAKLKYKFLLVHILRLVYTHVALILALVVL